MYLYKYAYTHINNDNPELEYQEFNKFNAMPMVVKILGHIHIYLMSTICVIYSYVQACLEKGV